MGSKNNPGKWDCYANAEPDEPMFVLLGRDPTAALVVEFWHDLKQIMREQGQSESSDEKLAEARTCASAMRAWAAANGKEEKLAFAREAFKVFMIETPTDKRALK